MNKEDIVVGMMLLRNRPNYSYVIVEKEDENTNYTIVEAVKECTHDKG